MEKINFCLKQKREHLGVIIPAIARVVHKRMDEFSEKSLYIYIYILSPIFIPYIESWNMRCDIVNKS